MFGSHYSKTYTSTQDIIGPSSREAEFYGIVRAGSHGLGMDGLSRISDEKFPLGLTRTPVLKKYKITMRHRRSSTP